MRHARRVEALNGFLAAQPGQFGVRVAHVARHRVVEGAEVFQVVEKLLHQFPSLPC